MVTAELLNYIKEQISQGQTSEIIKTTLLNQGWSEIDIEQAFSQVNVNQPVGSTNFTNSTSISTKTVSEEDKPKHIFDFKKLKWYEWLALIPAFFLLVQGGAVGAAIGVLGWSLSLKVMRNENMSGVLKAICVLGITVGYILIYFIIGSIFIRIIQGVGQS